MKKVKISFSGHDKFECKSDWITKGLMAYKKNNEIFLQSNMEESIATLGLGINMIKSLQHWMKVLELITKDDLTILGQAILDNDPYLENIDTLWILHWNLAKNRDRTTLYNLFFNKIYPHKFSKNDIFQYITLWLDETKIKLSPTTLNSDIDVFIRLYSNNHDESRSMSLLSDLNIITKLTHSNYSLNINSVAKISDEVFLYIFCDYIETQYKTNIRSISIDDIQRGVLSIQKSLCMGEHTLYSKIHRLPQLTDNKFTYSEAAGIKQIYMNDSIDKLTILTKIYE